MQIGGHIELDETPWQTVSHELEEESGYILSELRVLQHLAALPGQSTIIEHPVPFSMNTHEVGNKHYHSDLCYGFVADAPPKHSVSGNESLDLRWLTVDELREQVSNGEALADRTNNYSFMLEHIDSYELVEASKYSLEKPSVTTATYKR